MSRCENAALSGKATQSSIVAGGATGGQPERAIDNKTDSEPKAGSTAFTTLERNPWWEVDLGDSQPIESIAIWNQPGNDRTATLHVQRARLVAQAGLRPGPAPGSDRHRTRDDRRRHQRRGRHRRDRRARGGERTRSRALRPSDEADRNPGSRRAAIAALRAMPQERWPAAQLPPLVGVDPLLHPQRADGRAHRPPPSRKRSSSDAKLQAGCPPKRAGARLRRSTSSSCARSASRRRSPR